MDDDSEKHVNSLGHFFRRLCFLVHGMLMSEFCGMVFVASWDTWDSRYIHEEAYSWAAVCLVLIFPLIGALFGDLLESSGKVSLWQLFKYTIVFFLITFLFTLFTPVRSHR